MARNKARLELSHEQEGQIVAWYRENEILYNSSVDGFYDPSQKERLWLEKANELGITSDQLQVFIRDLRTQFVKMVKMDAEELSSLTERKKWLLQTFEFLRAHVSHRLHAKKTKKGSQRAGRAGGQALRGNKGNKTASQGAGRAGSQTSRGTKVSRKGDQEQLDSLDMDMSEEEEEFGWVMKDNESASPSPQGEEWVESSPENRLPGQASLDEGHASQQSVLDLGQDIPPGLKRRKLQPAYCAPPSVQGRLTGADAAGREAPTISLNNPVPPCCSSSEDQGPLGYCFTCQNPLLLSDSGKMPLLAAVEGTTKLLYILRQMGWPGLYSQNSGSRTCCGACAQLIWEYNDMLKSLLALKAKWMRCTGHNSAPHFNQFHHEASMTRDSCIDSSISNSFHTERKNKRVQAGAISHPCREERSDQFTKVQQDTRGVCPGVNSGHVSDGDVLRVKDEPHEDGEPHQVFEPHTLLTESQMTQVDADRTESVARDPQVLPRELRRPDHMTEPSPYVVIEMPRKASQSYQLQPGIADNDPSVKSTGQGMSGKVGLSDRDYEMLYRGTVNLLTAGSSPASEGESFARACDRPPPAASPDEQLRVQGQKDVHDNDDIGPKTDHNYDPGQGKLPVAIKQEQNFYGK